LVLIRLQALNAQLERILPILDRAATGQLAQLSWLQRMRCRS
jgi:hypothetical protein